MKHILAITALILCPIAAAAQDVIYEKEDSTRIELLLQSLEENSPATTGELLIGIAKDFLGEKYLGGTLERGTEEPLFISCSQLDCTTFVELVLAIARTSHDGTRRFEDVCNNLERIRYRNGKNSGYTSRLHYISWWIADNAKKRVIEEITPLISNNRHILELNFMSRHPESYPLLVSHPELTDSIAHYEAGFCGTEVFCIPKEMLNECRQEDIKEGDIIAITTAIEGLDVSHIGFAYYNKGELCLLHASSGKGMVVMDNTPLSSYLASRKSHTGIRVFRAVF